MIRLENVYKELKGKRVFQDINLTFNSGKAYLLKGHNGSGKTMLLRMLCGLIQPTRGIVVVPKNMYFGVIIENPAFLESETALYNLRYLANINKRISDDRIYHALKIVNLYDYRNDKVKMFSLGMKQRLAMCQAIMEDPNVLLLDEPFNALDEDNYKVVCALLAQYKRQGRLIIVAAHNIPEQETLLFDQVITMNDGKVLSIEGSQSQTNLLTVQ
ncbi:MAG TPA: ABC transporter ATP-binding protein [Fermentimonas sp.]|nr:ABC transporter ATP-binding protein [Fermentimonas sp.]